MKSVLDDLISEVAQAEVKIAELNAAIAPNRIAANVLAKKLGLPEPFANVMVATAPGTQTGPRTNPLAWRSDQFYNRPLAECVTEILETRKAAGIEGPATMDAIFDALKAGNYRFTGGGSDENSKRAVKISLAKNNAFFAKIGDDSFGLRRWYGPIKRKARGGSDNGAESSEGGDEAETQTEEESPTT